MNATGCAIAFLLPFLAGGIFAAVLSMRAALAHQWEQSVFLGIFALTFGGVGIGGISGSLVGARRSARLQELRETKAESPWLWRPDWAAGFSTDATGTTTVFAWIFTLLWNLIGFPSAYLGVRDAIQHGNTAALLVLLFPAIGMGLLVWAVRSTLQYRRYGVSRFELKTVPGVIGHSLAGTLRLPELLRPEHGFDVTLTCVRRHTTGGGRNRSTSESILWQEGRTVSAGSSELAVAFSIPADALPSDDTNPEDRRIWRLRVAADVPGVDYGAVFEVPVFRTRESDHPRTAEEELATKDPEAPAEYRQPQTSRVEVSTNRRGTEIYYPCARNPGFAAGLTLFLAVWCGATWATVHFAAPLLFPILFGFFGILLLIGVLDLWLKVTRVTAEAGGVTIASGYLMTRAGTMIPAGEIAQVDTTIAMQSGATPYYEVTIVRTNGKRTCAGSGVRDKREAEWLASTIRGALGR